MNISNGETRKIKAIDRASVHRICSGQVVLTLATAVKELVENSIDAGATNIEVKLKEYGSELIEVADNGCGVKPCDYESLTLKHHTSKLGEFTDLLNIDTFGFRGEALSSLCALSKMTVLTCHRESDVGSRLEYDHDGRLLKQIPTARQTGTTVLIENLFSTLPVRHREFKKNLRKEYGKMIQLLTAYCLISTGKRITCVNNTAKGKKSFVLSTNGEQSIRGNISCIYGNKQVSNLMEFKQKNPSDCVLEEFNINSTPKEDMFRIEGYLSPSTHGEGRSSSDRQFFFIDGRPCDLPKVSKIINDVYHGFNRHQYPFICLNISLLKGAADVNVTPDKRQIFIAEEKWLLAVIKTSVSAMYEHQPSTLKHVSLDFFKRNNVSDSTVSASSDGDSTPNKTPSLSQLKRSCDQSFEDDFSSPVFKSPRLCEETGSPQEVQSSDFDNGEVVSEGNISYNEHQAADEGRNENSNERCHSEETASLPVRENKDHINFTVTLPFKEDKGLRGNFAQSNSFKNFSKFARDPKPSCSFSNRSSLSNSKLHVGRKNSKSKQTLLFTPDKSDIDVIIQQHELDLKNCVTEENRSSVEKVELKDFSSTSSLEEKTANGDNGDATNSAFSISVDENQRKKRKYVSLDFLIGDLQKSFGPRGDFEEEEGLNEKYRKFRSSFNSKDAELELQKEISKDMFAKMEIIGQFNLGFIITKFKEDLFIIDQHATDEKYNFEILQRDVVLETQKLLNPQTLALTTDSETVLLDNLSIFEKNGFKFNIFEEEKPGQRVQLVSVPVSQNWRFGKDDVDELIFMLSDNVGKMCRPSRVCQMFASRACRKSVMIGTSLSHSLMKKLICHMGEIEQPWNCPHGRPTMRHLFNMNLLS